VTGRNGKMPLSFLQKEGVLESGMMEQIKMALKVEIERLTMSR
jgi:hypothetical protein